MICIKSIEIIEVEENWMRAVFYEDVPYVKIDHGNKAISVKALEELITGKIFVNCRGEEVCIGMSKQVQDLIGLPFEVMDKLLVENAKLVNKEFELTDQRNKLINKLDSIEKLSFWQRLKMLFIGYDQSVKD